MKFFCLAVSDYEDYHPVWLTGPEDLTEEQYESMVEQLVNQEWEKIIADPKVLYAGGWEIHREVLKILITQKGFKQVKYYDYSISNPSYRKRTEKGGIVTVDAPGYEGKKIINL